MTAADPEAGFALDPRLEGDTAFITDWPLCRVLLMEESRFPWLVLVPRRAKLIDLDELARDDQVTLLDEINRAMALLRWRTPCDKLNVGALGNIVRQLHVHVVARRRGDAAWPGPVWGYGRACRYTAHARSQLVELLSRAAGDAARAPERIGRRSDDEA